MAAFVMGTYCRALIQFVFEDDLLVTSIYLFILMTHRNYVYFIAIINVATFTYSLCTYMCM